ncbi:MULTISPECIES: M14 family metallopeptidase [Shewanella]|uniref:N-acetyl-ornithine deacetylase n=1 Tax=Shewanella TaxID=22 RepID=UPI001C65FF2B|nr:MULTISPECIES: M14 family metallocarboxypeptidase [Shewanella]QYJ76097.1 M14 family metallocarboxypeptidase [Shewanella sp. FJAT-52076]QYK06015.1 M14 family metallocarboxypeptidase [Shewanella zhangzhouensis]
MSRSPFQTFVWRSEIFECQSTDIQRFYSLLAIETERLGLGSKILGQAGHHPLYLLQSPGQKAGLPNLLISAGFHGEESAGPWGLLHFLSQLDGELFKRVNLSVLPLVNPTGFAKGHRFNELGENPNRGFFIENGKAKPGDDTSAEGRILLEHAHLLQVASRDGILTCHEDVLLTDTYVYTFEPSQAPGRFSHSLRDALGQYFPIAADGDVDNCPVRSGVIFNHFDTSFESFLVRSGARVGCCSETPGQQPLDQRILANAAAMNTFVNMLAPELS